ncbi:helix-hairpin-helix domain-containing protein, partial [Streptomyces sp. NPDC058469]|uniref:helix-hairpin-helix domain-containing protein n=1 Tax=Streptomyces sp. NPDC058469 TaxID=3346514 RepID=UPI003657919A
MSTDPETTETSPSEDTGTDAVEGAEGTGEDAAAESTADTAEGAEGTAAENAEGTGEATAEVAAAELSEAAAELVAQRLERERIERRKAEKAGPIVAGTKLSGTAADLLAAVRAVESGEKPAATPFAKPQPAPRRAAAPEAAPRPQPVPTEPGAPATETVESVRRVLAEGGAPETLAAQAAAALGEGGDDQLREDPWQLLRVPGVRPEQADGFARALLGAECAPDDERRGRAVIGWLLEQAALAGHTALEASALTAALAKQGVPDPDAAAQGAIAEGEVLVFQDALDEPAVPVQRTDESSDEDTEVEERPVRVLIGLERYALAEESLADGLAKLINSVPKEDGSAADWERAGAAKGSTGELIRAVAGHGLVLHTGGEASLEEPAALLRAAAGFGLRAWAAAHGPVGRDRFAALLAGSAAAAGSASGGPGDSTS